MCGQCPARLRPRSLSDIDILLRRTICDHLRRARLGKILNVFRRIRLRFFPSLRPRIWRHLFRLVTKAMSDRLLARIIHERVCYDCRSATLSRAASFVKCEAQDRMSVSDRHMRDTLHEERAFERFCDEPL